MNKIQAYKILEENGFKKASEFIDALNSDTGDLATKGDIKDLEIRVLNEFNKVRDLINNQTWKFLSGITIIAAVFKLADLVSHYFK